MRPETLAPEAVASAISKNAAAIPSLDGIRAVAVTLVFLAHAGLDGVIPGGLGVTIFFVLSGYLISTLLRLEYADSKRVNYGHFYLRRLLRLMPPLVIVVLLTSLLALFAIVEPFKTDGLLSVLFYFGNYYVIANNFQGLPEGMAVVWSLAVEEHYYLLYPPLAALLLRLGRSGVSIATISVLCFAVLAWRCWLAINGASADYVAMSTDTRIDAILFGCLLALCCNPWLDRHGSDRNGSEKSRLDGSEAPARTQRRRDLALIALSIATLSFTLLYRDEFFRMTFRYTLQSAAIAVLLYFAVARHAHAPFRWLNNPVLTYIGTISYTVYLAHHIIIQAIANHLPQAGWLTATLAAVLLTWAVAEPMRRWVEVPCARLRKRLHKNPTAEKKSMQTLSPAATGSTP